MGHRANFVVIESGRARAWHDQWAALGCTLEIAGGPDHCREQVEDEETVDELLDWAFAEAGWLLDFDERRAILFGYPDVDEIGEADGEIDYAGAMEALRDGWDAFLRHVAGEWSGWTLVYDGRGVDAFAEHLARRSITDVATEPPSCPAEFLGDRVELRVP